MSYQWQHNTSTSVHALPAVDAAARHSVLVCDVVESVRWMHANEAAAVAQWQAFAEAVKTHILPTYGGRIVKSLGDGLMLDFADQHAAQAVKAAFALQDLAAKQRQGVVTTESDGFWLRIGIHHTLVTVGADDIYGNGVNLCARIATLAGPGEVIITAEMRDQLTDQLDADIEDMGECFLKHLDEPVRVYRAGLAGAQPIIVPVREYNTPLQATIAVIPFAARSLAADNQLAVGEIIADGVIGQLSRTRDLKVISRLSTSVFRNRVNTGVLTGVGDIESHLGANYVLSGSYIALDKKLIVTAELAETKTNHVVWMDRILGDVLDILQLQSELCHTIANAAHMAILETEVQAALTKPLPTLESYSLLLGGISMMHRQSKKDFFFGRQLFEQLIEKHNQAISPKAWLAKWHILGVAQGWKNDLKSDYQFVKNLLEKSHQFENMDSFSLTVSGLVSAYIEHDLVTAEHAYRRALEINPNESLAWLCTSTLMSYRCEGKAAAHAAKKALELSPCDPNLYYYYSLASTAVLSDGDFEAAIDLANKSLKGNKNHTSTYRALAIAQQLAGKHSEAKQTIQKLLLLEPMLTVSQFSQRYPGIESPNGLIYANALSQAGLPN